ncbi:uncharacterized protein LOC116774489 isoform X2 [Danaus plexippus]|uniref:uncharacterized protein LOC116774489 isoform X2 n=1 Tax=Danaus plexippus TaxID=13037 RepID=UPI002AAFE07B|nr:uncharacterized protein LOC116774489 isoform X2 [Danaus plexippus]
MSLLMLILIFVSCDSLSIGAQKNVKRDIENNFNPDWAQLKNTQEGELKELIQVRAKPKKRLALPVNFILRAVAEPEGDDYYDKGQGESDNEDYFEKREWSDLHRPVQAVDANTPLNPANLSDIDGIINIITKPVENPIEKNSRNRKVKPKKGKVKNKDKIKREYGEDISDEDLSDNEKESEEVRKGEPKTKKEKQHRYEDDVDYEEGISEKQKSDTVKEEEQRENEAKKIKILQSVDELKAKHAQEQRAISEKAKEEEIHKEEIERDRIKAHPNIGKYDHMGSKWKKVTTDYNDEYEDQEPELKDKYKINHWKSISVEPTAKVKPKKIKTVTGKLSVFRNPHLYMINDDEDEITTTATRTTTKTIKLTTSKPKIYSSKYSAPPEEDNVRISLVPEDESKEGEPTLFFPKVKNIRKPGIRTTNAPDSFTSEDRNISLTSLDATAPSTTFTHTPPSAQDTDSSASQSLGSTAFTSVPTEIDTGPSAIDQDLKSSPSDEMAKKEAKKNQNYDVETGKEKEHHSKHEESHEEHGRKAYEDTGKSRNVQERNQQSSQPQQLKHWEFIKKSKQIKGTTTRKIIWTNTTTTERLRRSTMMKRGIMDPTTTRKRAKNMPSMRNQVSIRKVTAQKAVTTSTRRTNMKRKSNSLKKKVMPLKTRPTEATTRRGNVNRVVTTRRGTVRQATPAVRREIGASSQKDLMGTTTRATVSLQVAIPTAGRVVLTTKQVVWTVAGNGSTTTAIQPKQPTLWS